MSDKNDVVIIELDKPRILRFGHKALKTLGAMTGKTLNVLLEDMKSMDFENIEVICYFGLISDAKMKGEELKLEDMEDLLDLAQFNVVIELMMKAINASFGAKGEQVKNVQGIAPKSKK